MKRLPTVGQCGADWDAMTGNDRVRHCSRCDHEVHDLTALTAAESAALVARGGLCVTFAFVAALTMGSAAGVAIVHALPDPEAEAAPIYWHHTMRYLGKYEGHREVCTRGVPRKQTKFE